MKKESSIKKGFLTGVVVPLGSLRTKKSPVIGEYLSLIDFIPFCQNSSLELIQLLPVNDSGTQTSPYSGLSAFALHPIYISVSEISEFEKIYSTEKFFAEDYDFFIKRNSKAISKKQNRYDYRSIHEQKISLLKQIFEFNFEDLDSSDDEDSAFSLWIDKNPWVKSYSVFKTLKEKYMQASWKTWSEKDKKCDAEKLWNTEDEEIRKTQLFYAWIQYICYEQFKKASDAVANAGIILKGDMPILMNEDSCDAWEKTNVFNHNLRAGSPPDGDNPCGQNWGFPIYNWKQLKKDGYTWWKERLLSASQFYKAYRLDHILGFYRIWAVPENDTTAALGHTEPYVPFTSEELANIGFDEGRVHWLAEPHIPTSIVEDITWNHDVAHNILNLVCCQLGNEELWNFKKEITGDKQIFEMDFSKFCEKDAENRIKEKLSEFWRDRCILQLEKKSFVPVWKYKNSTAWKSLNDEEKQKVEALFTEKESLQNKLWEKEATDILKNLTNSVDMIPCGEDLGVGLECVPVVMNKFDILSLKVVRWCRKWEIENQPYVGFDNYPELSVTTTSVHDSSTLRQWWQTEKQSVQEFLKAFLKESSDNDNNLVDEEFSPKINAMILETVANSGSAWCIHPLQDFLYLEKKYYLDESDQERINIPGTVSDFNWTYQLPVLVEDLTANKTLISSIKKICKIHKNLGGSK